MQPTIYGYFFTFTKCCLWAGRAKKQQKLEKLYICGNLRQQRSRTAAAEWEFEILSESLLHLP